MHRDIKFIALFSALVLPLLLLLGVNGLIGILLVSCICATAAELLTRRGTRGAPQPSRKWLSLLFCAGVSAAVESAAFTARMHLLVMAISITGSPYDAPRISTLRVFAVSWIAAFVSVVLVLAVLRMALGHRRKSQPAS